MTESIVPHVIERLDDVLNQDYLVLKMLRKKLERVRIQFVNILRSLQAMGWENPNSKPFSAEVREVGYKVEEVLDKLYLKVLSKTARNPHMAKLFLVRQKTKLFLYNIGKELKAISRKVGRITSEKYGTIAKSIEKLEGTWPPSPQYSDDVSAYKGDAVMCHTEEAKLVVEELLKVEEQCRVLTICGMGGLGKTTLAKIAFYRHDVRTHFWCVAWTSASQQFRTEDVLRQILGQFSSFGEEDMERMKEVELVETVYAALERKRYLVIVDDIWSVEAWKMLQSAFPTKGIKGSKVVLTTRNKNIAAEVDPHRSPFVPHVLNDEEAWGMLCTRLFGNREIMVAEDIKSAGQEMVKECGGLPLAIGVLSSILQETKPRNWQAVAKDVGFHVSEAEPCLLFTTLMLSYYDLPYHLKPCFLFLGIFPKGFSIPVNVLIQMWIAEGFVSLRHGDLSSLEEVGRRFLDELIQRSLVQVVETNLEGRVKTCQLHAMMRYACIKKAREDKFLEIIGARMSSSSSSKRCAIYLDEKGSVLRQRLASCLRSAIFFTSLVDKSSSENFFVIPYKFIPFRHLRVLDFFGVHFPDRRVRESLSQLIGGLCQLKYLGLRGTGLDKLPKSIGDLVCLQFFDVRDNKSMELPNVIWKMRELRCFYIDSGCCKENAPLKMDTLRELQVASHITAGSWTSDMFNFTNLQKLRIGELMPHSADLVIGSIAKGLDNLQSLSLQMKPDVPFPNLEQLSKKHQLLKLSLIGKLSSTPYHWPSDVVKLRLCHARLVEDPMPLLGKLQKLRYLGLLSDAYLGKELVCSTKGFPRLLYLLLSALPQLEVCTVEKEAMPYLTRCDIMDCKSLKVIPGEFQHRTSVQKVKDNQEINVFESNQVIHTIIQEHGQTIIQGHGQGL